MDPQWAALIEPQEAFAEFDQPRTHQGQAELNSGLATLLLVEGADLGPFGITEQGQALGTGDVAPLELGGAAPIDQRPLGGQERLDRQPHRHPPTRDRPALT